MGCPRRGELAVRVDHKDGSITFVDDFFTSSDGQPSTSTRKMMTGSLLLRLSLTL